MPREIKTRSTARDVKLFDRAKALSQRMKQVFVKTKSLAEEAREPRQVSPAEYAEGKLSGAARETVRFAGSQGGKALRSQKERRRRTPERGSRQADIKRRIPRQRGVAEVPGPASTDTKSAVRGGSRQVRTVVTKAQQPSGAQSPRTKNTAKGIKTVRKSVRGKQRTIKTAQKTAQTAQKSAKTTVQTAKRTEQALRESAKITTKTAKTVAKAAAETVKAAAAAVKALGATVAAGSWVAVVILLLLVLTGLLLGGPFGVFFSGEDSGGGKTMPETVAQLSMEYYASLDLLKANYSYDLLELEGALALNWSEILAVYAVKATNDPERPSEVVTLDEAKTALLRGILRDMNSVKLILSAREVSLPVSGENVTLRVLTVATAQKSAAEAAAYYGFGAEQTALLEELLSSEYAELWARLLGGYALGGGDILTGDGSHIPTDVFAWPLAENYPITSGFGYRADPFTSGTKFHGGIDLAAPEGTPILAAADGIVTVANAADTWGSGFGYHVKVRHSNGFETLYAHCSKIAVRAGEAVKQGQVIGLVGSTGNSTGNHLHWEVRRDGERTDPMGYFQ